MPTDGKRLECLDAFRGVAIVLVFLVHLISHAYGTLTLPFEGAFPDWCHPPGDWTYYLVYPATFGWGGVAVFFVVSGFCIHLSRVRSVGEGWVGFYRRRAWRILPPYFAALAVFCFLWPLSRLRGYGTPQPWLQLVSHFLLLHNVHSDLMFAIDPVFWSIAIEVQLYLLYPLLLLLARRLGWGRTLAAVCLLEVALRATGVAWLWCWPGLSLPILWHVLWANPLSFWGSWSLGAYLAERYVSGRPLRVSAWWYAVAGVPLVAVLHVARCQLFAFPLFAGLAYVALARSVFFHGSGGLALPRVTPWLRWHLCFAGACSYSLYLWHDQAVAGWMFAWRKCGVAAPLALFLLTLPLWVIVLGFSQLLYRYLERPAARLGVRKASTVRPAAVRQAA
jgi:peptidoglycan/LPS O-acetylase OafA/YrhL